MYFIIRELHELLVIHDILVVHEICCQGSAFEQTKSGSKSVESCSTWFSTQKRNLPLSKSVHVHKGDTGFI